MKYLSRFFGVLLFILCFSNQLIASEYHVLINNEQQGPLSATELKQMVDNGSVTPDSLVWKNGMAGWEKAGRQADLQTLFSPATPPPVPSSVPPVPPPSPDINPASVDVIGNEKPATTANNQQEGAIDPTAITSVLENTDFISSSEQIRDTIETFREKNGIDWGQENEKGQSFYYAVETVSVDVTNPQWPKWRVVAYKKAFSKIQQKFVEEIYGDIGGKIVSNYFQDESDNRLEFPSPGDPRAVNKYGAIADKLAALAGAKLDHALEELGIDPAQYNAAPPEQRKQLFQDNLVEKSVKKAAGQINGLVTIKTFEGEDSKGNHTIGVVAMYYPKMKQLADDIIKKRPPMLTSKKNCKPVKSFIPTNEKILSNTFGVQVAFDENGSPVLISYGQWSYVYKGVSERKRARGYDFALDKAKTESQKQIAQFLESRAAFEQIETTSAKEEEVAIMDRDSNLSATDINTMIDKLQKNMTINYKADLRGIRTAKQWSYKHPSGHEIVGVVSVWTQKNATSTDNVRNWKSNYKNPNQAEANKPIINKGKSGVNEGAGMNFDF